MVGDILQPTHLLFVLVVALVVLGPKRLPEVGRSLGRGIRDFKDAISGEEHEQPEVPSHVTSEAPGHLTSEVPNYGMPEDTPPAGEPARHSS